MNALPYLAARENAAMWRSIGQHYRAEEWERRANAMIPKPPKSPSAHEERTARARSTILSALSRVSLTTAEVVCIINLSYDRTAVILRGMENEGLVCRRRIIPRRKEGAVVNIWSVKKEGAA